MTALAILYLVGFVGYLLMVAGGAGDQAGPFGLLTFLLGLALAICALA